MADLNVSEELVRDSMEQINGLLNEADELSARKKEWRAECKNVGLDPKIIEKVVKLKRADPEKVAEEDMLLDVYKRVAGIG